MTITLHEYRDDDRVLEAAVARPGGAGGGAAPAVLVAHAWAGRGEVEHAIAERLAGLGYVGIAIDVYGKGVRGDPSGDNTNLISPWLGDRASLRKRMAAAVAFAKGLDGVDAGRIAAVGYCFGGLCVLDLARSGTGDVQGVVSMHGMLDGDGLGTGDPIAARIVIEHGWLDPLAPPEKFAAFAEEMGERRADWRAHVHGRAMHAFTREGTDKPGDGMKYDPDADRRSWASLELFLKDVFEA